MTVLTATIDGAIDDAARDIDTAAPNVGPGVEEHTLVTLTGTEDVADNGMGLYVRLGTRHADGATHDVDDTLAS